MRAVGISHIGNSRSNQEDNFLLDQNYVDLTAGRNISKESPYVYWELASENNVALIAVSDGMGGHASGEVASYLTVKHLSDRYYQMCNGDRDDLQMIITELNRYVAGEAQSNPELRGMGATLCGFVYNEGRIIGFNVGDSRLYCFKNGILEQLSKDHSEGQRLLDLKLLNEEEIKSFPNRKAIYKHIGMSLDLVADVFNVEPCVTGDILLLCTDGLTDALQDSEIQSILGENLLLNQKCEKLLDIALSRNVGHGDNITIILTEF